MNGSGQTPAPGAGEQTRRQFVFRTELSLFKWGGFSGWHSDYFESTKPMPIFNAPEGEPAAGPPARPTTGNGASVLQALDEVCLPAVQADRDVAALAPAAGFKRNRRDGAFHKTLGRKPYEIIVAPRGANQTVCSVQLKYPAGAEAPLREALHVWYEDGWLQLA